MSKLIIHHNWPTAQMVKCLLLEQDVGFKCRANQISHMFPTTCHYSNLRVWAWHKAMEILTLFSHNTRKGTILSK